MLHHQPRLHFLEAMKKCTPEIFCMIGFIVEGIISATSSSLLSQLELDPQI